MLENFRNKMRSLSKNKHVMNKVIFSTNWFDLFEIKNKFLNSLKLAKTLIFLESKICLLESIRFKFFGKGTTLILTSLLINFTFFEHENKIVDKRKNLVIFFMV